jgi:hypothetical protein
LIILSTMPLHMRRFTRLTNAFSKKLENHAYAVALHQMFYNFTRFIRHFALLLRWPLASLTAFGTWPTS